MNDTKQPTTNAAIIKLVELQSDDIRGIDTKMDQMMVQLMDFKLNYTKEHEKLVATASQAEAVSKKNENDIECLRVEVDKLARIVDRYALIIERFSKWAIALGTPVGIAIIIGAATFFWSLITHQVSIVTPGFIGTPIP